MEGTRNSEPSVGSILGKDYEIVQIMNRDEIIEVPTTVDAEPLNAMASGFDPLYRFRRNLWKGPGIVNRVLVPFWEKIMKSSK